MNGHFVATKEAGQGKSDDAEAAWVEREEEVARVKARLAKVTQEIEDSQRYVFDLVQGMDRECIEKGIEKERRRVEEWNAGVRKETQKEKQELKWRVVQQCRETLRQQLQQYNVAGLLSSGGVH